MAGYLTNVGALGLVNGSIDWEADDIRVRLSETTETLARGATSMTGVGLSATDVALTGEAGPTSEAGNRTQYTADSPITFTSVAVGPQVNKFVVFKFVTDDAGSTPIGVVMLSSPMVPDGSNIVESVHADGLFYLQS